MKTRFTLFTLAVLTLLAALHPLVVNAQGTISSGENKDGAIALGETDSWTFTANVGDSIVLRIAKLTDDGFFYPWIRLYGPDGALLNSLYDNSAAEITRQATNSGTFTVLVLSCNDKRYSVSFGAWQEMRPQSVVVRKTGKHWNAWRGVGPNLNEWSNELRSSWAVWLASE